MLDGDRFYRRLRGMGKGWVSISRIACNNDDITVLSDKVLEAIAENFRSISDSIEKCVDLLHSAFEEERWQKRGLLLSPVDSFVKIERALGKQNLQGNFQLNQILINSIKKVFLVNKNDCLIITEAQINEKIGETLAVEITDSRLSCVRDFVMDEQNRNGSEQREWEKRLFREISAFSKKLIKLDGTQIKKVRKPVTRRIDRNATANILNRSLSAL